MARKLILWQKPMQQVLYALAPLALAAVYFFGWQALLLLLLINGVGFLLEYLFLRRFQEPVSSAVFVTNTIFVLSLPPGLPAWMAVLGIVVALLFGKLVFGGFGRNVFNPAMVGRAFIYVSFGQAMTGTWPAPYGGALAGLGRLFPDAASGASALAKDGPTAFSHLDLLLGRVPGSLGETSALLIILGGCYLLWKKTANYRIVVGGLLGFLALQSIFWLARVPSQTLGFSPDPLYALLAGGWLFGIFFVATDPISAAQTNSGRWLYGLFVGLVTVLIRTFSIWPEGLMFAVLLGNMFAPITDYLIKQRQSRKKAAAA